MMERYKYEELLISLSGQAERLIKLGYHTAMGMKKEDFIAYIIKTAIRQIPQFLEVEKDEFPILLFIPDEVLSFETQLKLLGIESDHKKPIWDINDIYGITTSKQTLPLNFFTFGVQYMRSEDDIPLNILISRHQDPQYSRDQFLTLAQSLAMIVQFKELLQYCEGLVIAGSYWYNQQVECAGVYTCLGGVREIMGRPTQASYCGHLFALREKEPKVSFKP
ncbi:MAG: hypothetical protein PHU57_03060 [Patescibacteria group bacterium]|nr:hypothetical protein [Patescibacteria group bacterium]